VVTGPVRQRLVNIVSNRPDGIPRGELMDALYAGDPDGGPEHASTVAVLISLANKQMASQGFRIVSDRGPGARYRLVRVNGP
jgi:hypothetical protein